MPTARTLGQKTSIFCLFVCLQVKVFLNEAGVSFKSALSAFVQVIRHDHLSRMLCSHGFDPLGEKSAEIYGSEFTAIVGFHMTSLKFKLKNYRSYRDFTFTMH